MTLSLEQLRSKAEQIQSGDLHSEELLEFCQDVKNTALWAQKYFLVVQEIPGWDTLAAEFGATPEKLAEMFKPSEPLYTMVRPRVLAVPPEGQCKAKEAEEVALYPLPARGRRNLINRLRAEKDYLYQEEVVVITKSRVYIAPSWGRMIWGLTKKILLSPFHAVERWYLGRTLDKAMKGN